MSSAHSQFGSMIDEISDGIYRISISVPPPFTAQGFSFNQYLIVDEHPLVYHTGPRKMFPLVREAIEKVMPASRLSYIAFSHVEADECGGLNDFLAVAPQAVPVCGQVAAMVSINDLADRPPKALADGEVLSLGRRRVRWFDTPHLPPAWKCGAAFEETTGTLLCGDLFTQPGHRPHARPDRIGYSRSERGFPSRDGLLRPRSVGAAPACPSRRSQADDIGVHARQRLAWRRRGLADRTGPPAEAGLSDVGAAARGQHLFQGGL